MNIMCNPLTGMFVPVRTPKSVPVLLVFIALAACSSSTKDSSSLLNDFRQDLTVPAPPKRMSAGQTIILDGVVVRNAGQQIWKAGGANRVEFTYNWVDQNGKLLSHGNVTILPVDLKPGESAPLMATILAPPTAGHYTIRFTMIAENIAWFSDMGGRFVDYSVDVVPQ